MVLQSAAFAGEALFRNHSVPMWIYDLDSLAFLEVNDAAIARYGWSRDEFLSMTIADIRPAEDLPALRENLSRVGDGLDRAGVWRHRLKSGRIIHVEIISHALAYRGRRAEMVSAHDVTAFVEFERDHAALLSALPGSFVVLTPDDHRIMAVSESYLNEVGAAGSG